MRIKNNLTNRERQVLTQILQEHTSLQIADQLHLSVRTVETHRKNIWQKTGSKTIIALVKYSIRAGMMEGYYFGKAHHK